MKIIEQQNQRRIKCQQKDWYLTLSWAPDIFSDIGGHLTYRLKQELIHHRAFPLFPTYLYLRTANDDWEGCDPVRGQDWQVHGDTDCRQRSIRGQSEASRPIRDQENNGAEQTILRGVTRSLVIFVSRQDCSRELISICKVYVSVYGILKHLVDFCFSSSQHNAWLGDTALLSTDEEWKIFAWPTGESQNLNS